MATTKSTDREDPDREVSSMRTYRDTIKRLEKHGHAGQTHDEVLNKILDEIEQ